MTRVRPQLCTWTPDAGDVGTHSVRVTLRNSGSTADFENQKVMPITINSGSGATAPRGDSLLTRVLERLLPHKVALSMSVTARYASQAAGDVQRHSVYTPELNLMSESETSMSSTPAMAYDYIWFGGKPVAQVDLAANTTHWTFTDHLGTPIVQTDATGTIDWRAEYEPFGSMYTLRTDATRHQPLRFPGQEADSLNGEREYNIFRWYRTGWGRYTQADPVLRSPLQTPSTSSLPVFSYGANEPLRHSDSLGLVHWECHYYIGTGGFFGGVGAFRMSCLSDCYRGRRVDTTVHGFLYGGSATPGVSVTFSWIYLEDATVYPSPQALEGSFSYTAFGGALGPGYSITGINSGIASGSGHGPQYGYSTSGIDQYWGTAKIAGTPKWSCCN
jgi:RHS repeat-associated protein